MPTTIRVGSTKRSSAPSLVGAKAIHNAATAHANVLYNSAITAKSCLKGVLSATKTERLRYESTKPPKMAVRMRKSPIFYHGAQEWLNSDKGSFEATLLRNGSQTSRQRYVVDPLVDWFRDTNRAHLHPTHF